MLGPVGGGMATGIDPGNRARVARALGHPTMLGGPSGVPAAGFGQMNGPTPSPTGIPAVGRPVTLPGQFGMTNPGHNGGPMGRKFQDEGFGGGNAYGHVKHGGGGVEQMGAGDALMAALNAVSGGPVPKGYRMNAPDQIHGYQPGQIQSVAQRNTSPFRMPGRNIK